MSLASSGVAAQSGQGLERAGRWFTYDGQPVYLVGFDRQEFASDPHLDYVAALDTYVEYGINKVRIWIYNWWGGDELLTPWRYDPATEKHDLDAWDPVYWERLRAFVAAAEARDVIVELSLFADYSFNPSHWTNPERRYAWNRNFNVNGAFSANSGGGFFPEFFALDHDERSSSGKTLGDYQQALIDKTLQEVGSFPNIYFEIANELPGARPGDGPLMDMVEAWQRHWASYIQERSPRPVVTHAHSTTGPHTTGVEHYWDDPAIDGLGFHFYSWDPALISDLLNPVQVKGKIITNNETFGRDDRFTVEEHLDGETRFAWALFTSGGYIGHYDYDMDYSPLNGGYHDLMATERWGEKARRVGALGAIAESVRFWELSPVDANGGEYDGLVFGGPSAGNWQVLANPGSEYVAYFWGTDSGDPARIQTPPGTYDYAWHDVRNAGVIGAGSVPSRGVASIPPPAGSWKPEAGVALVLRFTGEIPEGATSSTGHVALGEADGASVAGMAVVGSRSGGVLVSEATFVGSAPVTAGRIPVVIEGTVSTAVAVSNPSESPVTLDFYWTDAGGADRHSGTTAIPGKGLLSAFLNEPPFAPPPGVVDGSATWTFTFQASRAILFTALRGRTNARSAFLMTPLPVTQPGVVGGSPVGVARYATGAGWETRVYLVNPTDDVLTGTVHFFFTKLWFWTSVGVPYVIPPRAATVVDAPGTDGVFRAGWARVDPSGDTSSPGGLAVVSQGMDGITISESGEALAGPSSPVRLYAEYSTAAQTGFAVANPTSTTATIEVELFDPEGLSTGARASLEVPANGRVEAFLDAVASLGAPSPGFRGSLEIRGDPVIVVGLKRRYDISGALLVSTTPAVGVSGGGPASATFFAEGGGYSTEFVRFPSPGAAH